MGHSVTESNDIESWIPAKPGVYQPPRTRHVLLHTSFRRFEYTKWAMMSQDDFGNVI